MWYVGVDAALKESGVVIIRDGDEHPTHMQMIYSNPKFELTDRLHEIRIQFHELMRGYKGDKTVTVERPFAYRNHHTHFVLSCAHAVFSLAAYDVSAHIIRVPPEQFKKFVMGERYSSSKHELHLAIRARFNWPLPNASFPGDIVDAFGLAHFGRCCRLLQTGGYKAWQVDACGDHLAPLSMGALGG